MVSRKNIPQKANKQDRLKSIILYSGGLDSTVCLFSIIENGLKPIPLTISYSQRHHLETEYAKRLLEHLGVEEHFCLDLNLPLTGGSALIENNHSQNREHELKIPKGGMDLGRDRLIPITYVPARNLIFLSIAMAFAEAHGAESIYIGVNALDYSGYPDCRPDFIEAFQKTAKLATRRGREGKEIKIKTPLIDLEKHEIIQKGQKLGVPFESTWSCYDPQEGGVPCCGCDSCILRLRGFQKAGFKDPLLEKFGL